MWNLRHLSIPIGRQFNRDALVAMNRQIVHRGPDDEGFFVEENVGLAMRRLSIIDIKLVISRSATKIGTSGSFSTAKSTTTPNCAKKLEARGHRYRSRSDTETIVHLYEEYGLDCVNHLRGMFAFAIWDRVKRRLFLARDRLGIKPLLLSVRTARLLFGSEIKTILAYPGVKPEFNRGTLAEYLAFGYISGEHTMYAGIRKLLPGHTLELDESGQLGDFAVLGSKRRKPTTAACRANYYVRSYRELLEACVSSHLMSDVPLGVFLSGGLDSSAVAALDHKNSRATD